MRTGTSPSARVLRAVAAAGAGLVDLVLDRRCAGCGSAPGLLCPACARPLGSPPRPAEVTPSPHGLPPVLAVAEYAGVVRTLLIAHKDGGRLALAGPLGRALARAVAAGLDDRAVPVRLVPVPSAAGAVRRRGHDHTWRAARSACRSLRQAGVAAEAVRAVRPVRRVADQSGLGAAARSGNLAGAFAARPGAAAALSDGTVVVVDDVVTTGASLAETARALRAAGVAVDRAAVVAATRRRRTPPRAVARTLPGG